MKNHFLTAAGLSLVAAIAVVSQSQSEVREIGPVLLVDNDTSIEMKYSIAATRGSNVRAGVFSVAKAYLVFGGPKAALRTKNTTPSFDFYADSGFNVASGIYLFRFDTHKDRREIRVGKAQVGKSSGGIPKDHFVPTILEETGKGQNSTTHYRMKPSAPLKPGEYCLVRSGESCFDFGVDP